MVAWLPRWLGMSYVKLYARFNLEPFDFEQAREALGLDAQRVRLSLSRLKRAGYMVVFGKAYRRRFYRLLDPSIVLFALGVGLKGYERVQGAYTRLILLFARRILERYGGRVVSIVLYGSVARGCAEKDSDLDQLLIIEDLPPSYSRRIGELVSLEFDPPLRRELEFLRGEGYAVDFSYVPLTPEEAKSFRPLFLDVLTDGICVFDRDSFFERQASIFLGRLSSLGARRMKARNGLWYWMVKPDIKLGEMIQV